MASAATNLAREHIDEIRREKFSIGGKPNPLTEDLHNAVRNLSAELYTKDVHFLMELIQNAEDNEYSLGVEPSLEFVITSKDITCTGASATLLVLNNEIGFSKKNVDSICSIGRSTKKGRRREGFVGEKALATLLVLNNETGFSKKNVESICSVGRSTKKGRRRGGFVGEEGIGFKSVFLVTSQPYIFSNGYQIKFTEEPSLDCSIGYIVPQWVESNPTITDIHRAVGFDKALPMTTIVLPLKSEKVEAVKKQLSNVHPELLLFLSKIKRVSVRENNDNPQIPDSVSAISITSEKVFETREDIDADSYIIFLSAEEGKDRANDHCNYYMWRQRFAVKGENKVEVRKDVDEWVISLAFPFGVRLKRGSSSAGVYAFLPTEMVTNFPFIIQADFLLSSSRETILLDNKWNKGILDCVSSAFVNALSSLAKSTGSAPISSIVHMFDFLPIQESPFAELNVVRGVIKTKIQEEHIMPCETFSKQVMFLRPCEVERILPAFREILLKLNERGVSLKGISSHGKYILHSDADLARFDKAFEFLGVGVVCYNWYAQCIQGCGLVLQADEDTYMELLCFLADNWSRGFAGSIVKDIPLLKYVNEHDKVSLCSVGVAAMVSSHKLRYALDAHHNAWINKWNLEFRCIGGFYILPNTSASALSNFCRKSSLCSWLQQFANVESTTLYAYSLFVVDHLKRSRDRSLVLPFTHFLYHSLSKKLLLDTTVAHICCTIPVIDKYSTVIVERTAVLMPASWSKWAKLLGPNPFQGYVEMAEAYFHAGHFAGEYAPQNQLLGFIEKYLKASDIPYLCPPDIELSVVFSPLSKEKAILLLEWIQRLRSTLVLTENRFLRSVKEGKWLKTYSGYSSPTQCFLSDREGDAIFSQMGNVGLNSYAIDEHFYDNEICAYKDELKAMGVRHGSRGACKIISEHLMSLSSSLRMTKEIVISMLAFIRYLTVNKLLMVDFIDSIKLGCWLKSTQGYRSPVGSVYLPSEKDDISQITNLPLVDELFYGSQIALYREELKLLGVVVDLELAYPMIAKSFELPSDTSCLRKNIGILILNCVRNSGSQFLSTDKIRSKPWLKTSMGYKAPTESILSDPCWDCISHIAEVPLIDESFYGSSIRSFKAELEAVGVAVEHTHATSIIASAFQKLASLSSLTADHVRSLLHSLKQLKGTKYSPEPKFKEVLSKEKWLLTHLGYRSAEASILFGADWQLVSGIADLPLINDDYYGKSIYSYKDELSSMGVIVNYNEGFQFVAMGLKLPKVPDMIKAGSVVSLLECVRTMLASSSSNSLPDDFLKKTREVKWLKTQFGYRYPQESFLFGPHCVSLLEIGDAPFIDELFYGNNINSYKDELKALGVIVDVEYGCSIIAHALSLHSNLPAIKRLYNYLNINKWAPKDRSGHWIWIPNESCTGGDWVGPDCCVLSDMGSLFGSRLRILDKYYYEPLLSFFSSAFGVPHEPSMDEYIKLWTDWEDNDSVNRSECCSYWAYVIEIWNLKTEKKFSECIRKLPAKSASGSGIQLVDKHDVFIPDDLQLKLIFEKAYPEEPLFVWYPDPSMRSVPLSKLYGIYCSIGVKKISESVLKCADSLNLNYELRKLSQRESPISNGLVKIILGFLANPCHGISAERRHGIVQALLDLAVFETDDPITVSYNLLLQSQSGNMIAKEIDTIRWEKNSQRLIIKKVHGKEKRAIMEFATNFAKVVSNGMLWDSTDLIDDLSRLIQLGCILGFDEGAVDFLLITENLLLFREDEEFLSAALSSNRDSDLQEVA